MVKAFNEILRDFATDGVPSSGPHQPIKADFREALTAVEAFSNASGSALIYQGNTALNADLAHAANTMAWVVNDGNPSDNGVYQKQGASGTGSWTRVADLPYSFIVATNSGAGTATAIQATTAIPVTSSALVILPIVATASSSSITVSFNGGTALTIKTVSGGNASTLTNGMWILGVATSSDFRMVNDQDVSALVVQAEAARDAAQAAANSINQRIFTTLANAQAEVIPASVKRVLIQFLTSTLVPFSGFHARRVTLAALAGYPASAYFRSSDRYLPDGTTDATNGGYWLNDEHVGFPEMFGGVASSAIDSKQAISDAVRTCPIVDGRGQTFGASGNIEVGATFDIRNISVVQLDPSTSTRRTITTSTCSLGRLTNVNVNRNGDGTYPGGVIPAIDDAEIGIRIACAANGRVFIDKCTVFGNGFGGGIAVYNATSGYIRNCWVHDMRAGNATYAEITDDAIEGIKIGSCTNFVIEGNRVNGLTTQYLLHTEWNNHNRAISVSGGSSLTIQNNLLVNVGQAIDISGDLNPRRITVRDNRIDGAASYGVKCANSTREVVVQGNNLHACGVSAVVISAPTSSIAVTGITLAECSGDILICDNIIRETGDGNTEINLSERAGILIATNHSDYAGYPKHIRIINNDIVGNGNMPYGIRSTVDYTGAEFAITEKNNRIEVFATARTYGIGDDSVSVYNTANVSIPTATITAITWSNEDGDTSGMFTPTGSSITIKRSGYYMLSAQAFWAANATGDRQVRFYKNGTLISRALNSLAPTANDLSQPFVVDRVLLAAGDTIDMRVYQNSGAALNLRFEYTYFTVRNVD